MVTEQIHDIISRMLGRRDSLKAAVLSATIIVVDDMSFIRKMVGLILQTAGFTDVHFADDGQEALDLVARVDPDILIIDLNMPGMSGIEVCNTLRADEKTADLPIIIQSMMEAPEDRNVAFSAGATDYICKPINAPELLARVCIHLENRLLIDKLTKYQKRIDTELSLAREMQNGIMPSEHDIALCNELYGLNIEGYSKASSELGGDIWGINSLTEHQVGFFILDVSGHGVGAALNTFRFHQEIMQIKEDSLDAGDVLVRVNDQLAPRMPTGQFATMLYGVIDIADETLTFASAAQPAPFHISDGSVARCESEGFLVGAMPNLKYDSHTIPFKKGDSFFTYSDALIETKDSEGVILGEEGIYEYLQEHIEHEKETQYFDPLKTYFQKNYSDNLHDDLTLLSITRV